MATLCPRDSLAPVFRHNPYAPLCAMEGGGSPRAQSHHPKPPVMCVTLEDVQQLRGTLLFHAQTPTGCSFLQAGFRSCPEARAIIISELRPHVKLLVLDDCGAYVVRTMLESLSPVEIAAVIDDVVRDEALLVSLFTRSLHTRRCLQFLLDRCDTFAMSTTVEVILRYFATVACTRDGCIGIQRVMERCSAFKRSRLLDAVAEDFLFLAQDPYANYLVQLLIEASDAEALSPLVVTTFRGRLVQLSCDKYASNIVEKAFAKVSPLARDAILTELLCLPPPVVLWVIQNNFGNFCVQSLIANAPSISLLRMAATLEPLLDHASYGMKIRHSLARRLCDAFHPPQ